MTEKVYGLLKQAKALAQKGDFAAGERLAHEAWDVLPEPKLNWDCTAPVVRFQIKFYRDNQQFSEAHHWADLYLSNTQKQDPSCGNSYLMKGSIYHAQGDTDRAREYFQKAYDIDGKRGFQGHSPAYLKLVTLRGK